MLHISWLVINTLSWTLGFIFAVLLAMHLGRKGDIVAVVVFAIMLLVPQFLILQSGDIFGFVYLISSTIGMIVGVGIAIAISIFVTKQTGLVWGHIIAYPITLIITALFQWIFWAYKFEKGYVWVIYNIVAVVVSLSLLSVAVNYYNPQYDFLTKREKNNAYVPSYALTGFILGISYAIFTSIALVSFS